MSNQTITPNQGVLKLSIASAALTIAAGSLALGGIAPIVGNGQTIAPASGHLNLSLSQNPAVTPASGSLSIQGIAPNQFATFSIAPPAGALAIAGQTPVQTLGVPAPITGTLSLSGQSVTLATTAIAQAVTGALNLQGAAPIPIQGAMLAPAAGSMALSGKQVTSTLSTAVTPAGASLALSGKQPLTGIGAIPNSGNLVLQGYAPVNSVVPNAGQLNLAGASPSLLQAFFRSPTQGSISLQGQPVGVGVRTIVSTGAASLQGVAPSLFTPNGIVASTAAITISGAAAQVSRGTLVSPAQGGLSIQGQQVSAMSPIAPNAGALSLIGSPPVLASVFTLTPGTGSVTIVGYAPVFNSVGLYQPDSEFTDAVSRAGSVFKFPTLGPTEARVLTFDFGSDLDPGEQLSGLIRVGVTLSAGTDPTPTDILAATPSYDPTMKIAMQPINCALGEIQNDYYIVVTCPTTNPEKEVARYALLQIRS